MKQNLPLWFQSRVNTSRFVDIINLVNIFLTTFVPFICCMRALLHCHYPSQYYISQYMWDVHLVRCMCRHLMPCPMWPAILWLTMWMHATGRCTRMGSSGCWARALTHSVLLDLPLSQHPHYQVPPMMLSCIDNMYGSTLYVCKLWCDACAL